MTTGAPAVLINSKGEPSLKSFSKEHSLNNFVFDTVESETLDKRTPSFPK